MKATVFVLNEIYSYLGTSRVLVLSFDQVCWNVFHADIYTGFTSKLQSRAVCILREVATKDILYKKLFLKLPEYSQQSTCVGVSCRPSSFIKKRLKNRCFPVNITKFLRTPILKSTSGSALTVKFSGNRKSAYGNTKVF